VEGVALGLRQRLPGCGVVVDQRDVLHASLLSEARWSHNWVEAGGAFSTSGEEHPHVSRPGRRLRLLYRPRDRGGTEHMIYIWNHDIARQRQQELLAAAERHRLARNARDQNAPGRTGYCKKIYAALLARVHGVPYSSTDVSRTGRLSASERDREVVGPR